MAANKIINIGMIGGGMIAEKHIESLSKNENSKIIWIATKTDATLKRVMDRYKIPRGTTNYKEILSDSCIDAVIICTPPNTHCKIFMDSINSGKHILLEKPMGINSKEIKRMLKEAEKHPDLIMANCSSRHSRLQPKFQFIKDIIDSGELGRIYYIHHNAVARQSRPGIEYHPKAKWFLNKKLAGGGPLIDWGVYDLSFHLGILDDNLNLKNVKAFIINGLDKKVEDKATVFDVEEHYSAYMEFDTGLVYYWERSTNAHNEAGNETRIYGTKAGLKFSYSSCNSNEITKYYVDKKGKGEAKKKILKVDMSKHKNDMDPLDEDFISAVINKTTPAMPLWLAGKHLDIIFKIYKNCRELSIK